jgi:hypothetical protein
LEVSDDHTRPFAGEEQRRSPPIPEAAPVMSATFESSRPMVLL